MKTFPCKAVELDNLFGGTPIQHRETQGHESVSSFPSFFPKHLSSAVILHTFLNLNLSQAQFKKYFEPGMVIKKGGMESGLQKAETNAHEAKLFKVAGGMRPVLTEVTWS